MPEEPLMPPRPLLIGAASAMAVSTGALTQTAVDFGFSWRIADAGGRSISGLGLTIGDQAQVFGNTMAIIPGLES
jgi:hypothetical protein